MKKGSFRFPLIKIEGGENPDPVIYCPANGYIPDPEVFHPPFPLPEVTEQSIVLICNAAYSHWRCATFGYPLFKTGSNPYLYEIFDNTAALIDSFTSTESAIDFDFPTTEGYYTVKISLSSPTYFTGFYKNTGTVEVNHCIEAILMNTPNLTQFSHPYNMNLTTVEWANAASFEALGGMSNIVSRCAKFSYFKFKDDVDYSSLSASFSMFSAFAYTGLRRIDLSNLNDTAGLYLTDSMFKDCKYLDEVIFPSNYSGKRIYNMFQNTPRLRRVVMPDTWISNDGTHDNAINNFFYKSGVEGEIIFNEITNMGSWNSVARDCPNLEILRIKGSYTGLSSSAFQYCIYGCTSLRIFEAPRSVGNTAYSGFPFDSTSVLLEEYIGPDIGYIGMPTANSPLKSITGEHDVSGFATIPNTVSIPTGALVRANLITLQMSKLRVQRFICGTTLSTKFTALNSLEIDWANSSFASASSPQLSISAAIGTTEINRILTALPTVTSKTADFRYCDGYVTCDKTIATAKGWTML